MTRENFLAGADVPANARIPEQPGREWGKGEQRQQGDKYQVAHRRDQQTNPASRGVMIRETSGALCHSAESYRVGR